MLLEEAYGAFQFFTGTDRKRSSIMGRILALLNVLRLQEGEKALKEQRGERRAQKVERLNKLAEVWGSEEE